MSVNTAFIEPMSTAAMSSGSDLTIDLFVPGIGMKMGLSSRNAGIAAIGLTCFVVGVLVGVLAVHKLDLKCDDIIGSSAITTPEDLRARLEALEFGSEHPAGSEAVATPEQQDTDPEND